MTISSLRSYFPILFIGLCYLAISMMWTLYSAYVPVFLILDFRLSAAAIGGVMMLDNLAGLLIQPWIGARSDRLRSPLGRRLPIILIGAPVAALAFGLIPFVSSEAESLLSFFLVLTFMLLAMAAIRVPLFALMPDLVPQGRRSTANGLLNLFGGLGTLIAAMALGSIYRANRASPFWIAAAALVASVLLLTVILWRAMPERLRRPYDSEANGEVAGRSVWQMLRDVLATGWRGVPLLLLSILVYTFGLNALETFFSLYGIVRLGLREEQGLALLGLFFGGYMLASVPAGMLGERFSRRSVMAVGLASLWVLLGGLFLLESVPLLRIFMPVGGFAWALVNSNALPAVVDTSPPAHAGSAIGLFYATATLASILSPLANGWLVDQTGGDYGLIVLVASLFSGLGALCMLGVRRNP